MSRSNDPGHFFQTETSLSEINRRAVKAKNKSGDPITLSSKILAVLVDPTDDGRVYAAESGGLARRIELDTKNIQHTFRGPEAPLTSLTIWKGVLYAGCWDKTIWSWDTTTREPGRRFSDGHTDFVKAVVCTSVNGRDILVSGAADALIIVWDLTSGTRLHTLKGHARGVLALAIDEITSTPTVLSLVSAGSDREIRRWRVALERETKGQAGPDAEDAEDACILQHETSVFSIQFDADGDLWTASADTTAKCLVRLAKWMPDTTLPHPDFVRHVLVHEASGLVFTACRDEEVRVWERGSGNLYHVFSGHYEEVTSLCLARGPTLVSVSIDGTLRRWGLRGEQLRSARLAAKEEREREKMGVSSVVEGELPLLPSSLVKSITTADEDAELAALMADDK
ncbi:MAG: hypothetical protein M1825_005489 [Sarcosagium campestre]|nr:MAG: hypothetical protein M1825_005489 [Sarcosagium campestre]